MIPRSSAHCLSATALFAAMLVVATTSAQASVEINASPTKNMNCAGGTCSPTAKNAVLNTTDLANMLATGDVKVVTGNGAVTITVSGPISWTSSSRLTLDAYYNVSFKAPVEVTGQGAVTITYNDGGTGGTLFFFDGGSLDFWDTGSGLIVNGKGYTLIEDLATMKAAIAKRPNGYYALARSYDATPDGVFSNSPITTVFTGMFEGLGHSIQNLQISLPKEEGTTYIGLFQQLGRGVVRDLGLDNVQISVPIQDDGFIGYIGTLVGFNGSDEKGYGTVFNSHATGQITTHVNRGIVGGLVGLNPSGAVVDSSYSSCNITVFNDGSYLNAAGLVGENDGLILNSHASGLLTGTQVAGLAAINDNQTLSSGSGEIDNSYFDGSLLVYAGGNGFGLVGDNQGTIRGSHATSDIITAGGGSIYGAGLVGDNEGGLGVISNSYATGNIARDGNGVEAAGLVATNGGQISNSFATGSATGSFETGGLVAQNGGTITNSYATGGVAKARDGLGGLVGNNLGGTISTSYSIGAVVGGKRVRTGGLAGLGSDSSVTNSYWDVDTSGQRKSNGGTHISDAELKSGLPAGFDPAIWAIKKTINNGYPYLIANPPPQ